MAKVEVIIETDQVSIETFQPDEILWKLQLIKCGKDHYIKCKPSKLVRREKLIENSIPSTIKIPVDQISDIKISYESFSQISIQLILIDYLIFPNIYLNHFPFLFLIPFIEYLQKLEIMIGNECALKTKKIVKPYIEYYGYFSLSLLPSQYSKVISIHNSILKMLEFRPLFNKFIHVNFDEYNHSSFETVKKSIYFRGSDKQLRPYVWDKILNSQDENINKKQFEEYMKLKKQFSLITNNQKNSSFKLRDTIRVINADVKRNDRFVTTFMDDNSPNLQVLHAVLNAYTIFNKDTGYIQGMSDIVSPLIRLFFRQVV